MDAHTRRLLEDMIDLRPTLTFSVGPGPPVTLTRQQVRSARLLLTGTPGFSALGPLPREAGTSTSTTLQ